MFVTSLDFCFSSSFLGAYFLSCTTFFLRFYVILSLRPFIFFLCIFFFSSRPSPHSARPIFFARLLSPSVPPSSTLPFSSLYYPLLPLHIFHPNTPFLSGVCVGDDIRVEVKERPSLLDPFLFFSLFFSSSHSLLFVYATIFILCLNLTLLYTFSSSKHLSSPFAQPSQNNYLSLHNIFSSLHASSAGSCR